MPGFSDYLETALLNATLRNTAYASPATVYVGLLTADPADSNVVAEVTGGAYARQAIAFGAPAVNGTAQRCSNSAQITFPQATAAWGNITNFGIFDAAAAGNLMYSGALSAAKTIANTDQLVFAIGTVTVDLD